MKRIDYILIGLLAISSLTACTEKKKKYKKRTNDSKQRKNSKNLRVLWEELLCIKIHNSLLLQAMTQ